MKLILFPLVSLLASLSFLCTNPDLENRTPQQVVSIVDDKEQLPPPVVVLPIINFPDQIPVLTPAGSGIGLDTGVMYVVTSDQEIWAWSFPDGLLSVTPETGPLRIRGIYYGGTGKQETRTIKEKYILLVEAVGTGQTSLLVMPAGATKQNQGIVKIIDANNGPRPPPIPVPPKPIPPDPTPSPAPIPSAGFRVLIVYETADLGKYTGGQLAAIQGNQVRSYLIAKCVKENKGQLGYRIWDKDLAVGTEPKIWQDAFARTRATMPWLVVSNGTSGWEGPLPTTVNETMTILKKYGD